MHLKIYEDLMLYYQETLPFLLQKEAANNLQIGISYHEKDKTKRAEDLFATLVDEDETILMTVSCTPPFHVLLGAGMRKISAEMLRFVAAEIAKRGDKISGVLAEKEMASCFAEAYAEKTKQACVVSMEERVYVLYTEDMPKKTGEVRQASEKDMHFLPYWLTEMHYDFRGKALPLAQQIEEATVLLQQENLFLLTDEGMPVCMAGFARETPNGYSVNRVYTPPGFRGRGYASYLVAALHKIARNRGKAFTTLFTNLANPVANHVYQKIGYQAVTDYTEIRFVEPHV